MSECIMDVSNKRLISLKERKEKRKEKENRKRERSSAETPCLHLLCRADRGDSLGEGVGGVLSRRDSS